LSCRRDEPVIRTSIWEEVMIVSENEIL